jgi:choice-of-anchor B domain-containing protein
MLRILSVAAAGCALAAVLPAQLNTRLLARVDPQPGAVSPTNNYGGVWGMVVNGRELALVPARTGTYIYDCSDPRNPRQTGFIAGPGSTSTPYFWREANSWRTWAYVSSEHGNCQVINLANPDSPVLAGTFGTRFHTVSVDPGTGLLWGSGGGARGCNIYNLNVSATAPPLINSWLSPYVHDCLPIRGHAYLAQISDGNFRIVDSSNPLNILTLSSTTTPGAFTHNVWVTDDDRIAVTADENMGGCLTIYDITDKRNPIQRATWCSPNGATVHNVFIKGSIAHFSCYSDGYWAVDISNPSSPRTIAQYDTTPLTGSSYHGDWGCYPFQPSGVIYLSDMQRGFHIVEPTCGVPNVYGAGTAGTGGIVPAIDFAGGFARVGNATFAAKGTKVRGGATAALLVALGQGQFPLLGVTVLVDPTSIIAAPTAQADGSAGAAGAGTALRTFPLPGIPGIANLALYMQFVAIDPSGPQGLSASPGMRVVICP